MHYLYDIGKAVQQNMPHPNDTPPAKDNATQTTTPTEANVTVTRRLSQLTTFAVKLSALLLLVCGIILTASLLVGTYSEGGTNIVTEVTVLVIGVLGILS